MEIPYTSPFGRRKFLEGLTLAGAAGLLGLPAGHVAAEPPPETTTLRLYEAPFLCEAPVLVAEELLRAEGFSNIQYVSAPGGNRGAGNALYERLSSGEIDLTLTTAWSAVPSCGSLPNHKHCAPERSGTCC
jgi:NitT/TauT family transport system substrate-binding protein